tara:strand:+ start:39 stop:1469 length:1431 start_codon:yes stop_codon:yes gene_type:complete
MPIFTVGAAGTTTSSSYEIANSLRFNAVGSDKSLKRTNGSAGNQQTMTFSFWVKRSIVAEDFGGGGLFGCGTADGDELNLTFRSNVIDLRWEMTNGTQGDFRTNRRFRDMSAWYHIVLALDSTQSTSSNRIRIYVNGVEETSFGEAAYPNQNLNFKINGTVEQEIGRFIRSDKSLVGYLAEFVFIDGQQLTPSSFGEFDDDNNWIPKDVSDLTFGSNGYHLDFEDSSSLGNDVSGNNNDWTLNNISATDQSVDTPTNNYATLNPLTTNNSSYTFASGALDATSSTSWLGSVGTIGLSAGKWYWEAKYISGNFGIGIGKVGTSATETKNLSSANNGYISKYADGYEYFKNFSNSNKLNNNSSTSYGSVPSANDIMMVAFDADNGTIWVGKQGTWYGSATQSEIEAGTTTNSMYSSITMDDFFLPSASIENGQLTFNFGSPPYSITSGNSDGNGHGNFEYTVPSGYYAINSKNLAQFG